MTLKTAIIRAKNGDVDYHVLNKLIEAAEVVECFNDKE